MIEDLKPIIGKLAYYAQKKMGFKDPPRLFLKKDIENSQKMFGRTAHYDPAEKSITIYINSRHPKDILRSFAHELVHHTQNLRGDLSPEKCGQMSSRYAQDNDHMRNMEKQAYLIGNMCFRDWEDGLEDKDKFLIKLAESKFLKEKKTMTKKITKELLKETIEKILSETPSGWGAGGTIMVGDAGNASVPSSDAMAEPAAESPATIADFAKGLVDILRSNEDETERVNQLLAYDGAHAGSFPEVAPQGFGEPGEVPSFDDDELDSEEEAPGYRIDEEEVPTSDDSGCSGCDNPSCDCKQVSEDDRAEKLLNQGGKLKKAKTTSADMKKASKKLTAAAEKAQSTKESIDQRIHTPEQENNLYERRFTPRNNRIFEKLLKEWTK